MQNCIKPLRACRSIGERCIDAVGSNLLPSNNVTQKGFIGHITAYVSSKKRTLEKLTKTLASLFCVDKAVLRSETIIIGVYFNILAQATIDILRATRPAVKKVPIQYFKNLAQKMVNIAEHYHIYTTLEFLVLKIGVGLLTKIDFIVNMSNLKLQEMDSRLVNFSLNCEKDK